MQNRLQMVSFSPLARIFEGDLTIRSPPALFYKVEISSHTQSPVFWGGVGVGRGSVHSGSAS